MGETRRAHRGAWIGFLEMGPRSPGAAKSARVADVLQPSATGDPTWATLLDPATAPGIIDSAAPVGSPPPRPNNAVGSGPPFTAGTRGQGSLTHPRRVGHPRLTRTAPAAQGAWLLRHQR